MDDTAWDSDDDPEERQAELDRKERDNLDRIQKFLDKARKQQKIFEGFRKRRFISNTKLTVVKKIGENLCNMVYGKTSCMEETSLWRERDV